MAAAMVGWKVDDRVGELSIVFTIGFAETAPKGRRKVTLVGIGSLQCKRAASSGHRLNASSKAMILGGFS